MNRSVSYQTEPVKQSKLYRFPKCVMDFPLVCLGSAKVVDQRGRGRARTACGSPVTRRAWRSCSLLGRGERGAPGWFETAFLQLRSETYTLDIELDNVAEPLDAVLNAQDWTVFHTLPLAPFVAWLREQAARVDLRDPKKPAPPRAHNPK